MLDPVAFGPIFHYAPPLKTEPKHDSNDRQYRERDEMEQKKGHDPAQNDGADNEPNTIVTPVAKDIRLIHSFQTGKVALSSRTSYSTLIVKRQGCVS